jgi:hypothetical protein
MTKTVIKMGTLTVKVTGNLEETLFFRFYRYGKEYTKHSNQTNKKSWHIYTGGNLCKSFKIAGIFADNSYQ